MKFKTYFHIKAARKKIQTVDFYPTISAQDTSMANKNKYNTRPSTFRKLKYCNDTEIKNKHRTAMEIVNIQ